MVDLTTRIAAYATHFPIGILGQGCYLIVSIPDLCTLTYFVHKGHYHAEEGHKQVPFLLLFSNINHWLINDIGILILSCN